MKLPYDQEIVDISVPRNENFLKLNPAGKIPVLSYNGQILTESAAIATFLADSYSSGLLPASTDNNGPLVRARIAFFVDAFLNKVTPVFMRAQKSKPEDRPNVLAEYIDMVASELEPQLTNAAPFFDGNSSITLAEVTIRHDTYVAHPRSNPLQVLTAPFVIRSYALVKHKMLPESFSELLAIKAPGFDKWTKDIASHPSVAGGIWDEEKIIANIKKRM